MSGLWAKLEHRLIDTHCHVLDYEDQSFIERLTEKRIIVHAVTTTLSEYKSLVPLLKNSPSIHPSMGLFPLKLKEELKSLEEFLDLIPSTKFIGEIGLDYTVSEEEKEVQRNALKQIVQKCHETGGRVLSLHSRGSAEDVLKIIGNNFNGSAIMHWYSGPAEPAAAAPPNIFFSVNTAMLKSRNGKEVLKTLKPSQILTETDGPYVKINDQSARPEDTKNIIQALSIRWEKTVEETLEVISKNYQRAVNFCDA